MSIHTQQLRHRYHNIDSGTFDIFDAHCDGWNGLYTHFAHQRYGDGDGVA